MRFHNISLLGLFAIVTCAAFGTSHAITSWRLSRANAELAELRQRLELIPATEPDQIAARRLPSSDANVHRWAVRIPANAAKLLYAHWGDRPLADIQDTRSKSVHRFQLTPDPATRECMISFRVERNPADSQRGAIKIEAGGSTSIIAIDPATTSLLAGDTPCRSESVGDKPVIRSARSPIILFATETTGAETMSFCLWLDQPDLKTAG